MKPYLKLFKAILDKRDLTDLDAWIAEDVLDFDYIRTICMDGMIQGDEEHGDFRERFTKEGKDYQEEAIEEIADYINYKIMKDVIFEEEIEETKQLKSTKE